MPKRRRSHDTDHTPAVAAMNEARSFAQALMVVREASRTQAEEWLDTSHQMSATLERYLELFENAPLAYFALRSSGTIRQLNAAASALLASPVKVALDKPFLAFVERRSARAFMNHLSKSVKGAATVELTLRGRDGTLRPGRLNSRGVSTSEAAIFTIAIDISEERSNNAAVRASEKQHREIVETANDGICIVNEQNKIVFANHRMATMVGTTLNELLGRSAFDLVCDRDLAHAKQAFAACDTGRFGQADQELRRIDGSSIMTSVSTTIMREEDGRFSGMLRMFTDATARRALDTARESLMRQVLDAQENERQRIARELHDQMGQHVVALSLGLARLESASDDGTRAATLAQLHRVIELLSKDTHDLALELRPAALDHLGFGAALSSYAETVAARANLEIDVHCEATDALTLTPATKTTLYRIAQEALTNIVKHAAAKHASVILERRDDLIQLIVEDDGVGFVPHHVTASALGLAGMRERVELSGGTMTIESSPGHGTTLYVRLPMVVPHDETGKAVAR